MHTQGQKSATLDWICYLTLQSQDHHEVEESWSFPGDLKEMLKVVDGWDEEIRAIMNVIPPEVLIDWKLLWRDPIKKWVSDDGRITISGDAAHPHLPTSGSGATQAIEDGATIGALLGEYGIENLPLAWRAFEKARYGRTFTTLYEHTYTDGLTHIASSAHHSRNVWVGKLVTGGIRQIGNSSNPIPNSLKCHSLNGYMATKPRSMPLKTLLCFVGASKQDQVSSRLTHPLTTSTKTGLLK